MEAHSQHRPILWATAILVVLNVGLLGLLWYEHLDRPSKPQADRTDPEKRFITELGLDQQQIDTIRLLRTAHLERTDPIRIDMVQLGKQITEELFADSPDTVRIRDITEQIGREQAEFEKQVYAYFGQIKLILREDQHANLKDQIIDALNKRLPQHAEPRDDNRQPSEEQDIDRLLDRRPPPPRDERSPRRDDQPPRPDDQRRPPRDERRPPPPNGQVQDGR